MYTLNLNENHIVLALMEVEMRIERKELDIFIIVYEGNTE